MNITRGRPIRIGLLLAAPYACSGNVPLGDKGQSASGGNLDQQTGGTSNQGGANGLFSGLGGTQSPSGGAPTSSSDDVLILTSTGGSNAGGGASSTVVTGGARAASGGASTPVVPASGASSTGGMFAAGGSALTGGAAPTGGAATTGGTNASGGSGEGTSGASATTTLSTEPECITSTVGAYWKSVLVTAPTSATADVTINDSVSGQTWEGFGGCFNERGWSYLTSEPMRNEAMELLFGTDGANLAWGRIPIGASDYAMDRYTLDDTVTPNDPAPNGESNRPPADTAMASFKIDRDKENLIPYIQAAQKVKSDIRFWAGPWTPPVWMKTAYKTNSGANANQPAKKPSFYDGGSFNGTTANMNAYADYYKMWIAAYAEAGINIEYVSPQNEPGYDQNYPSCLWDKGTYVSWIKVLGAAMSAINVKVMLGTLSNAGDSGRNDLDIASAVLADATARSVVSVVGVQWGVLDKVNSGTSFQGLPIWATEHKCGNYPWQTGYNSVQAPNDQAYAVETWGYIRDAITKGKVTAYNAWNMVLDRTGLGIDTTRDWRQDALLVADSGKVTTTPAYYVFRHFSQFVKPGAKVLPTTGGDAVAFKNPDQSMVAVLYNSGTAKTLSVKFGTKLLQFSMPSAGWATLVLP